MFCVPHQRNGEKSKTDIAQYQNYNSLGVDTSQSKSEGYVTHLEFLTALVDVLDTRNDEKKFQYDFQLMPSVIM